MNTADVDEILEKYINAAARGDLNTIKDGIENENGISAVFTFMLGAAAARGHCEIIKCLISIGADINASENGETPLLMAVHAAQLETTQLLIENGADVHARMDEGASSLHQAVKSYELANTDATLKIIDQLLAKGVEIEGRDDDGHTVLHDAASYGRAHLLPELIRRGAIVNTRNRWQNSPLDSACQNGYFDIVKILVSHGAEINDTETGGCKSLGRAALEGHLDLVTFLLDHGAKPLPESRHEPELLCAARGGVSEIVQLLIDHGYIVQGPKSLLQASLMDPVQVVAQLIDHGVRADVRNTKRQTTLHMAVLGKRMKRQTMDSRNDVIKYLIGKGGDISAVDVEGKTALDMAMELGYLDVVEIFDAQK